MNEKKKKISELEQLIVDMQAHTSNSLPIAVSKLARQVTNGSALRSKQASKNDLPTFYQKEPEIIKDEESSFSMSEFSNLSKMSKTPTTL